MRYARSLTGVTVVINSVVSDYDSPSQTELKVTVCHRKHIKVVVVAELNAQHLLTVQNI